MYLTCVLWIHMRWVEAEVNKEGNWHTELEPLHHIGWLLAVQGRGYVTPQDHALSSTRCHKPGLLPHCLGTCRKNTVCYDWSKEILPPQQYLIGLKSSNVHWEAVILHSTSTLCQTYGLWAKTGPLRFSVRPT